MLLIAGADKGRRGTLIGVSKASQKAVVKLDAPAGAPGAATAPREVKVLDLRDVARDDRRDETPKPGELRRYQDFGAPLIELASPAKLASSAIRGRI